MPMRRAKGKIKYINTPKYKMWAIPSFCSTSLSYNTVTVLFFNLEKKNQLILLRKKKRVNRDWTRKGAPQPHFLNSTGV